MEIRQRNRTHEYKHRQLCDRYTYIHINILYRSTDWIQHLFYRVGAGVGLFFVVVFFLTGGGVQEKRLLADTGK